MLRELAADRPPFEPLFKTPYTEDGHHTRRWLEEAMVLVLRGGGRAVRVPACAQGHGRHGVGRDGEAADVIADHLSYEKTSTMTRHYVPGGRARSYAAPRTAQNSP